MIRLEIKSDFENAESIIRSAVCSEIKRMEIGLRRTDGEIKKFEDKYQISSDKFVREYTAEDLSGGDDEYVSWMGEIKIMRRITQLILFSVFVMVATSGVAGTLPTAVTITDPIGDAGNFEGGMDITRVDLQTDGKDFLLTVTCKQDLANVLKTTGKAGYPAEVYLDTDNNPETGGESTFIDTKKGFEFQILTSACIKSGYTSVCGGNVKPEKVEATGRRVDVSHASRSG